MEHGANEGPPGGGERRQNLELRERLDEVIMLARRLSREFSTLSQEELDSVRARIEWLAEEIWQSAAYGPIERRAWPGDEGVDD